MANALRENLGQGFTISRKTFAEIEDFIADNHASAEKVKFGINSLAQAMVLVIKGEAQKRSGGPVAARKRSNPALAYRIPVQRITGRYFAGWMIRKLGSGHYLVYNDSVEAFLIETGMYQRVRRPILKMSMMAMLSLLQTTRTGERFMDWVMAPRRNSRGQFQSFGTRMGGTATLATGNGFVNTYGGSKSGKVATVSSYAMSGPKAKLPR